MAYIGPFVAADHSDLGSLDLAAVFGEEAYEHAAEMLAMNALGGEDRPPAEKSRANWGFLDGHAETRSFHDVYRSGQKNSFNPDAAKAVDAFDEHNAMVLPCLAPSLLRPRHERRPDSRSG